MTYPDTTRAIQELIPSRMSVVGSAKRVQLGDGGFRLVLMAQEQVLLKTIDGKGGNLWSLWLDCRFDAEMTTSDGTGCGSSTRPFVVSVVRNANGDTVGIVALTIVLASDGSVIPEDLVVVNLAFMDCCVGGLGDCDTATTVPLGQLTGRTGTYTVALILVPL